MNNSATMNTIFFALVFSFLMLFFVFLHPMTLISGDDWIGISSYRSAYPLWNGFNPSKVLPETLFPAAGVLSSIISKVFGVGYLRAVSFVTATLVSITATLFIYMLHKMLTKRYSANSLTAKSLSSFVLMALFFMLKTLPFNKSTYLLWEINITCYYHYVIPALLNSSVVMYLITNRTNEVKSESRTPLNTGIFIVAVYFSIFSNVFASIILAVYCGVMLLTSAIKARFRLYSVIRNNVSHILVLTVWVISLIFEVNGQRAASVGSHSLEISRSADSLASLIYQTDTFYVYTLLIGGVGGIIVALRSKIMSVIEDILTLLLACIIVGVGLVLISAKASPAYAERPAAMFGIFIFSLLAFSISTSALLSRSKLAVMAVPAIFVVIILKAFAYNTSLMNPHNLNLSYDIAERIGNSIIEQVIEADQKGMSTVEIKVPKGDDNDNWPWPMYMGDSISKTLRLNGIIQNKITVSVSPDKTINRSLRITTDK